MPCPSRLANTNCADTSGRNDPSGVHPAFVFRGHDRDQVTTNATNRYRGPPILESSCPNLRTANHSRPAHVQRSQRTADPSRREASGIMPRQAGRARTHETAQRAPDHSATAASENAGGARPAASRATRRMDSSRRCSLGPREGSDPSLRTGTAPAHVRPVQPLARMLGLRQSRRGRRTARVALPHLDSDP
jgi:hypothetical protein